MKYFKAIEKPTGKYGIEMNDYIYDNIIGCPITSSYNILYARLFGLHYADFLRFVRDKYNAEIIGKTGYPYFEFASFADANSFAAICNKRMEAWIAQ